jgi:uncharacterized membrane protein YfcA
MGLIAYLMEKARRMTAWDYAVFKGVLITLGIMIGAYLSAFVRQHIWYFAALFGALFGVLVYRLFARA